ncbi:hypothetical protein B9Z55_001941 [Caenorhabditis nigoni]|uniref:Uncharacterized protein n=1 Tax=Caenorhabditis nigoni TaxID=1611254 RepID=A0A2G5VIB9_9PELO|nr:hypothetical protein B9Z55_001941 [Caenorhabditis nigoni]
MKSSNATPGDYVEEHSLATSLTSQQIFGPSLQTSEPFQSVQATSSSQCTARRSLLTSNSKDVEGCKETNVASGCKVSVTSASPDQPSKGIIQWDEKNNAVKPEKIVN